MHYPSDSATPHPLTVILRANILSARSPQLRFIVRGTNGTYTKYGLDSQEGILKSMASPKDIFDKEFGKEPEALWGTVETMESDKATMRNEMYDHLRP
jgi:hypothetical protein